MAFLERERQTLERLIPGFDAMLAAHQLHVLEAPDGTAIGLLRRTAASSLLIPAACGGIGANALEAILVQRAIGARAPSLAVATTMHHFSVATLLQYSLYEESGRALLRVAAAERFLVASGFAEGRADGSILEPTVQAVWTGSAYRLSGSKKPCSLSRSMDFLSASVKVRRGQCEQRGIVVLDGRHPGLQRRSFWAVPVLAAAESDEVILDGIEVPEDAIMTFRRDGADLDVVEVGGMCWFTLLISACYLGIVSGMAERVLSAGRGSDGERITIVGRLESVGAALEGLAARMMRERIDQSLLIQAQLVRYSAQGMLMIAATECAELMGGLAFIRSPDIAYLMTATRALAFHPPSRIASAVSIAGALQDRAEARANGGAHVVA